MCFDEIPDEHEHVVNLENRSLMCTCRGCWMLFTVDGAGGGRYRAVPDRYAAVDDFTLNDGAWEAFQIPVSVAFFFYNSTLGQVAAFYPGPAGATESLLPLAAWDELAATNPLVSTLASDVEALIVRSEASGRQAYVVPIDACYRLVGEMRRLWRGFDGGREAQAALDDFFSDLRARSR